jgi:hypothetical protein
MPYAPTPISSSLDQLYVWCGGVMVCVWCIWCSASSLRAWPKIGWLLALPTRGLSVTRLCSAAYILWRDSTGGATV